MLFSFRMIVDTGIRVSACKFEEENHRDRAGWPESGWSLAGKAGCVWLGWISIVSPATWPVPAVTSASAGKPFIAGQRRYDPLDLTTLEERSHCPHHRRQPTWSFHLAEKVLTLRLFPRWGKDKLAVLLRKQNIAISTSMLGRILTSLKRQGRLMEPPRTDVPGSRRALRPRPYAVRNAETQCRIRVLTFLSVRVGT
jgi:hypothetical protein